MRASCGPADGRAVPGSTCADQSRKVTTLELALTTISQTHLVAGHVSPRSDRLVKETWEGARRRLGVAKTKKDPLTAPELRRMMDVVPTGLLGARGRALLLLGLAGGFRRSEFVALEVRDLKFVPEGLEVFGHEARPIRREKASPRSSAWAAIRPVPRARRRRLACAVRDRRRRGVPARPPPWADRCAARLSDFAGPPRGRRLVAGAQQAC